MQSGSCGSVQIFYPTCSREQLIAWILERLPALRRELPIKRVVLFGSFARGGYTVASDVDLLVVYDDPERKDAYEVVKTILDIPRLGPHVYSVSESKAVAATIERMIEGGIVLLEA